MEKDYEDYIRKEEERLKKDNVNFNKIDFIGKKISNAFSDVNALIKMVKSKDEVLARKLIIASLTSFIIYQTKDFDDAFRLNEEIKKQISHQEMDFFKNG